jgi:hypothetical protein
MLDLSRAQNIKNYKSSFGKTADKIIAEISNLKSNFDTDTASLNDVRKDRNEIIDKASKILQKNGIKLSKPLGKYDNFELCMILCDAAAKLDGADKETLEICSIQIDNRYHDIMSKSLSLETMMNRLSNMSVLEDDSHEEVVVDLKAIRKKKGLQEEPEITKTSNPIISNEEPVIPALDTFNESLEDKGEFEKITPDVEPEELVSEMPQEPVLDTIETEPELVEESLPIDSEAQVEDEIEIEPIEEAVEEVVEEKPEEVDEIAIEETDFVPGEGFTEDVLEEPTVENTEEVVEEAEIPAEEEQEPVDNVVEFTKYQTMSIKPIDDTLVKETNVMSDIIDENDNELIQVIGIKQASQTLIANVEALLEMKAVHEVKAPDSAFVGVEDNIIDAEDLFGYDSDVSSGLTRDLMDVVEDDAPAFVQKDDESNIVDYLNFVDTMNNDDVVSFDNQDDDSMPFTLDDKLTLDEIANNVYGDADLWKDLYKYGSNKAKIDKRAREAHVSVSVAATNPGYLAGLELNFPVELVTYEEVPEDNYYSQYSYMSSRGRRGRAA